MINPIQDLDNTSRADLQIEVEYWRNRALAAEEVTSALLVENKDRIPSAQELGELFAKHAIQDKAMFERRSYKIMLESVHTTLKAAASIVQRSKPLDVVNMLHAVTSSVSKTLARFSPGAYSVRPVEEDHTSTPTEQSNDQTPRT